MTVAGSCKRKSDSQVAASACVCLGWVKEEWVIAVSRFVTEWDYSDAGCFGVVIKFDERV
jgi:hypothetical protein